MSEVETTTVSAPVEGQPAAVDTSLLGSFNPAPVDNVLQQAVTAPVTPAAPVQPVVADPNAPDLSWMPEKFRTNNEQGQFDAEASARKMAESYGFMEKRAGSGDLPPASPTEYVFEMEGVDWNQLKADPGINDFLTKAHAMGMSNKQMQFAMTELVNTARDQSLRPAGPAGLSQEEAQAELRKEWATPDAYNSNMSAASLAVRNLIPKAEQQAFLNRYGNDPLVLKLMATVGTEFGEDRLVNFGQPVLSGESIIEMMQSEAYNNPQHPEHKRVMEAVTLHFQRTVGN